MIQIKSIQLSWVDVAKAVSSELQKLLGRCFTVSPQWMIMITGAYRYRMTELT